MSQLFLLRSLHKKLARVQHKRKYKISAVASANKPSHISALFGSRTVQRRQRRRTIERKTRQIATILYNPVDIELSFVI